MLISTWNEHLDIQANKLNANHLHAQHLTNAQYIKYMHLGTKSYKGTRVRILKENAKHSVRSIRQQNIKAAKHGTNHKSLQNTHGNKP